MNHYVGIDVSLEASSVCVVDGNGNIACEGKVASEPDPLIAWLSGLVVLNMSFVARDQREISREAAVC